MNHSKRLLAVLATCFFSTLAAHAAPTLSIGNTSAAPGASLDLPVNVVADPAAPFESGQFELVLPTGLTFISASTGTATLAAGKSVMGNLLSGNTVRTLIFGLNHNAVGSGGFAMVRVSVASNMTPGARTLNLSNVTLSDANNPVAATLAAGTLTILDNANPSVPSNVAAVAVSSTRINVSWTASTDNVGVAGYRVLRGGVFIASTTTNSFANNGLTPSTAYSYTIVAYDAAGNSSAASAAANATTLAAPDNTAPSVPTNVAAVAVSSTRVNVSWTASTDNVGVAGYRVLRGGVFIASTTTNSFVNNGLTPSTLYTYTIVSYDAAGNSSAASAGASATTLAPPDNTAPTTPTNVAAVAVSSTQINVSWTGSTDNIAVTGYQVFQNGVQVSTITTGNTSYAANGLTPLTSYSYFVRAFDLAGNISANSNVATAQTLATRCDINSDGLNDVVDLQIMVNGILFSNSPTSHDLNRDTQMNVLDLQILINLILGTGVCPL